MAALHVRIRRLASQIAKREGKKNPARIGDIREILGILADIDADVPNDLLNTEHDPIFNLREYAVDRLQKKRNTIEPIK